ncbi:transcription termination factor Rho [Candidatus Daviesbacteria bacterium RIFCSPHIGHO2_01_FULL_44_29]|uniref:Transcription termination factor Rho n=1 Tax=Candidatus Daviesbacteria bacterium RIFCSPHIGHO2_02_FULL_43_12 TaxID=1797776 RepID=A0A1F5KHP0_9BACT|nr:MAG: transcription termination factor Rho [Candidatus Daviesbacteria bacterium RIFCSPHIGHO2_01_FULL_44_29]OGE40330.1 MAG: transcription termination factor Rho [Candidatus Daviesbacteria bacterium RIFCSPHIGHO2_02_FULL_43_12]OGE69752.1 MAG: transcription termination factor Rho [Candidatus Daviesbacteria bacterium RIFCSPLOWO2_01_FULL_43_15]
MANTRSFKPKQPSEPVDINETATEAPQDPNFNQSSSAVISSGNETRLPAGQESTGSESRDFSASPRNDRGSVRDDNYNRRNGYSEDRGNYRQSRYEGGSAYGRSEGSGDQGSRSEGGYRSRGYAEERVESRDVPTQDVSGYLDVMPEGHGFLRPKYIPSDKDVYISSSQIRRFNLRPGDFVEGGAREPKENERYYGLLQVSKINSKDAEGFVTQGTGQKSKRIRFEDLTAIYPNKLLKLETGKAPLSQRVIDLFAPIGFGQRGLVVSPPKAGKTTILKDLAAGIAKNHPEAILMAVLVGERPEEVTDLSRSIKGDVIASNFDEPAENQTRAAEVALERAKRLVEEGKDVVILLDSITRLGRAYNLVVPPSGRTLSGGFDPVALYPPKHFFGAARNCEEGGSLTIIGTALVDTGSRMDDLIYEEFKGTGNMELHLDRKLAERRIFPAIDISSSGTRQEQLMFDKDTYAKMTVMHRMIRLLNESEQTEICLQQLSKTETNAEFLGNLKDVK